MGVQELLKVENAVPAKATYANVGNAGLLGSPRAKAKFGYTEKLRCFILGNDFFGCQLHKLLHILLEQSEDWECHRPQERGVGLPRNGIGHAVACIENLEAVLSDTAEHTGNID